MVDNVNYTPGTGGKFAADQVTYSGDTADAPLMRPAHVTGAEGSKTVQDVTQSTGSAVPAAVVFVGGTDGTNARALKTDAGGELQIDVLSVTPGTNATNLGKAEDAAHASGDVGVSMLAVRNDADAARSGTDGDYTPMSCDSAGNQNVRPRYDLVRIAVNSGGLTIATTAYTAGDQVGTQFSLANAARASDGTGMIRSVILTSAADIIGAYDVVLTRSSITLASDNAAYAISDADALALVALVQLAGAFDIGNNRIAQAHNLAIPYDCSGGTTLYASLICRVGHTFFAATTDLQLTVFVERN